MSKYLYSFLLCLLASGIWNCKPGENKPVQEVSSAEKTQEPDAISLAGKALFSKAPSEKLLADYQQKKMAYEADTTNIDNLIWYGRFRAYTGDYKGAIDIYSQGIKRFPEDARLYRHRGHRYISTRQLDKAIADFNRAVELIEGTENEIEPDGMPNARNIPVSTLHGNIWYHLGLAHYLKHDWPKALEAYQNCRATASNPDNLVSSTHWLYMIARRMGKPDEAKTFLELITTDMDVIENHDYHKACLFYKGELEEKELVNLEEDSPGSDAARYALGNWYYYHGQQEKAKSIFEDLTSRSGWASFGFIAAESDLVKWE